MDPSLDIPLIRTLAAKYQLSERTVIRKMNGATIRGAYLDKRAAQAVEEYHQVKGQEKTP
jgi:hypothetical protein